MDAPRRVSRLGAYEIAEPLGEGGMGRVFLGRDTRLGRSIAIKVLHPDVAGDPTHRARFEREAKAVAELTHPNICTLHDVGEQDGQAFLVMELLQGETLAAALKRRGAGLPADEAADIAAQVATALAFAHRQHVVHRDVKPSNIMLTPTGVKLLDFGLARPWETEDKGDQTTQALLTTSRAAVGTLPYMAPEQIDGKSDARTDIFALGAVIFEMLTGRRAFDAESTAGILAAVVKTDPPSVTSLRPDVPPAFSRRLCGQASDLCLSPFPTVGDRPKVIAPRAATPRWSQDGRELFYISDGQLWSVTAPADGSMAFSTPAKVFSLPAAPAPVTSYAVHPDGKRFILVLPVTPSVATVKVTLNWQPGR